MYDGMPVGAAGPIAHGGSLGAARRRFPGAPEPWVDLSTGINPHAYPLPDLPATAFARLPEPEALEGLQRVAAAAYGAADPGMVAAAPGTQILIGLLPRLWPQPEVAVLGPTYAEHAACWRDAGARVTEATAFEALHDAPAAVLCNPNNPDGRRVPAARLLALADRIAGRGGLLLVDEAFADLEPEAGLAPALPHPAVVILRSFGKTYGLAGVRLGFALAAPERAGRLRGALGPWAVSGPAIEIGSKALADRGWLAHTASVSRRAAGRLDALLEGAGFCIIGGTALFRLAEAARAQSAYERLGRAGILVRSFPETPTRLRFGLPATEAAWQRLAAALR